MLNWIKGEKIGKRGHTYLTDEEYPRFVIYPIGATGRFSLVEVTTSGSGRSEIVIVRGVAVGTCKNVAQQIVDEERDGETVLIHNQKVEGCPFCEHEAPLSTESPVPEIMPSAERRTKSPSPGDTLEVGDQESESELTNEIDSLESNTQRNVENQSQQKGSEPVSTATITKEPITIKEGDARRLMKAMGKPEDTWTPKRLQKNLNNLEDLLVDAAEVSEKEDRILLKEISRAVQEGEGVLLDSMNGNGQAEESQEEEEAIKPAKKEKATKPLALPSPPSKNVYNDVVCCVDTFTAEEMREVLGWKEVTKKDEYHFKINGHYFQMTRNLTNRPFRVKLALRYAMEHVRRKWRLNGEAFVIDNKGMVQSGQHRGAGFLIAEEMRIKEPETYGKHPLTYETVVVRGVESKNDVVDTIDLGQKRALGDVLFRNREMGKISEKDQNKLSRILAGAIRLVWLRVTGVSVMGGKAFLHSEALELLKDHPDLADCVKFVHEEDGGSGADGKRISSTISLAYAAGLMYLMAKAKGGKTKAQEFWTLYAAGAFQEGEPLLALKKGLERKSAGSGRGREDIIGMVVKAWHLWVEGKKKGIKPSDIVVKKGENPRFGGLDKESSENE